MTADRFIASKIGCVLLFLKAFFLIFLALGPELQAASGSAERLFGLRIDRGPKTADWRYFMNAPSSQRRALWQYHSRLGAHLKDWAWGWRLAWLRSCASSKRGYCSTILLAGLADRAMVVRAEAATILGKRYQGSKNKAVIDLLVRAFRNPRNIRQGKPLFVQNRILFALREIGGPHALKSGQKIASLHQHTDDYWQRLVRNQP